MKLTHLLRSTPVAASLALISLSSPPVLAQESTTARMGPNAALEEIVVTGRKREENLIDIPVAISVWTSDSLAEQGIITQQDLFDATVGISFNNGGQERTFGTPAVRGVQSGLAQSIFQKVNSFIDGQPMLGNTGSLQFFGIDSVEIYRGPQSAAFGRATFAGAINYVSADAAEEFEGGAQVRLSDLGECDGDYALYCSASHARCRHSS